MSKKFQIGDRVVRFVPEEPGVLLILLIVATLLLLAPSGGTADVDQQDADASVQGATVSH